MVTIRPWLCASWRVARHWSDGRRGEYLSIGQWAPHWGWLIKGLNRCRTRWEYVLFPNFVFSYCCANKALYLWDNYPQPDFWIFKRVPAFWHMWVCVTGAQPARHGGRTPPTWFIDLFLRIYKLHWTSWTYLHISTHIQIYMYTYIYIYPYCIYLIQNSTVLGVFSTSGSMAISLDRWPDIWRLGSNPRPLWSSNVSRNSSNESSSVPEGMTIWYVEMEIQIIYDDMI